MGLQVWFQVGFWTYEVCILFGRYFNTYMEYENPGRARKMMRKAFVNESLGSTVTQPSSVFF